MTRFALVENGTDKIIKIEHAQRFRGGTPPVFSNGKPFRWLPYTEDPRPGFDPRTHARPVSVTTVHSDNVTLRWTRPEALSAQELDAVRDTEIRKMDRTLFRVLLRQENRIRKLEGAAEITAKGFRAELKALLDA